MKVSVITPNKNGARYLDQTMRSVLAQRQAGVELEYIVIDGASTDNSADIIKSYSSELACVIRETDSGPAAAINKGLSRATGDLVTWLNADDFYFPGALRRVVETATRYPAKALYFGRCRIVDAADREIRKGITRFKELFFPLASRVSVQCINYISQPATFITQHARQQAGFLREDIIAAWDYDFFLRAWHHGGAARIPGEPLAAFRWRESSISGRLFKQQFQEEFEAAVRDAGRFSPQALVHWWVRWGIVACYWLMAARRRATRCG